MNKKLEHILLGSRVSHVDLRDLKDACASDTTLRSDVRVALQILEQIRTSRIQAEKDDFETAWNDVFEESNAERTGMRIAKRSAPWSRQRSTRRSAPLSSQRSTRHSARRSRQRSTKHSARRSSLSWLAAASIVVGLALFFYASQQVIESSDIVFRADADQFRVITMEDGSSIRLSPGSMISIPADGAEISPGGGKVIQLHGSAFFSVVPHAQPLRILTELSMTSVVGTKFGIVENDRMSQIFLLDGSVSFASRMDETAFVIVGQNESSRIIGSDPPTTPAPIDIVAALKWTDLVLFRRTPLREVASTLSSRFDVQVEIDGTLAELTFTNTFVPDQGVQEMLETVALALGIHLRSDPQRARYHFSPMN